MDDPILACTTASAASPHGGHPGGHILYFHPPCYDDNRFALNMNHGPPHTLEDYEAERRRRRWGYVLTPFFTLASIVVSVGMLMFFGKACQDRIPADAPLRTSPLFKQYQQPRKQEGGVADPSRSTELYPAEKHGPAPGEKSFNEFNDQ